MNNAKLITINCITAFGINALFDRRKSAYYQAYFHKSIQFAAISRHIQVVGGWYIMANVSGFENEHSISLVRKSLNG